ncbi:hypothetical protein [Phaeobacter gallaeciensis]|uniref:hypothetical protein n=1 Tax=Phaeobacter gallaeciensis TaxID=60890 RepID=UPI00237F8BFA|nr:hypothetical protein [Phaeobacter gallaeciensis]MDE4140953.1 hypothetical protein [Phaeobacter gallaeciensis]MDE4149398.1 hypothetical protein [Phaeobacter gallaeciensis]MDE4153409.1 hypothetical protein [Phaeobacter gallaeciensis]MDE4228798.1 hypothetical protein [Phaeobacter gallaeciensis]MDE4257873.1 hypothetical protein [Phaeobacter gallaeciensis]
MDHVLVKLKRLRKKPYKKLLSDTALFEVIDVNSISTLSYDVDHNLDNDGWFEIAEFSEKDYFLNILSQEIDAKDYDDLAKDKFDDISCILGLQGSDVYFQKVTPSSFIKRKLIQFGEVAKLEETSSRILIKNVPDAVYLREEDKLIFRDLATISSLFKGIDILYKEATDDEVKAFLASDFIELAEGYNHESVSKPNRKRLALVSETMAEMPDQQKSELIDYIQEYCENGITLTDDKKSFKLSTDNELKLVLYGIEERFYTTKHGQEKRLANSVQSMA